MAALILGRKSINDNVNWFYFCVGETIQKYVSLSCYLSYEEKLQFNQNWVCYFVKK